MSDKLAKWTGVLVLGVSAVAVAGGIVVAVYCIKKRQSTRPSPLGLEPVQEPVQEEPIIVELQTSLSGAMSMEEWARSKGSEKTDYGSTTYEGIYKEAQSDLKPLLVNKALYTAFIAYIQEPRKALDRFKSLSNYVKKCEDSLNANRALPLTDSTDHNPIMNALSPDATLAEVKALSLLLTALLEFPSHIVRKAVELNSEKRQTLINLIRSTPSGVSKHVYHMKEGPFRDPDLNPFMTRMGFSIPSYQTKLTFTADDDGAQLISGLYLLLGTAGSP